MRRLLVFVLLFLMAASCSQKKSQGPKATVSPSGGMFWFPVADVNSVWKWGDSPDNALEYEWMVRATLSGQEYEFGYTKWKFPGEQRAEGSLLMLLNSGQKNIWLDRQYAGVPFTVGAYPDGDGVAIYLTDPNLLGQFMTKRPAEVTFVTGGRMLKESEQSVKVTYVSEPNNNSSPTGG